MVKERAGPVFLVTGANGQAGFELLRSLAPLGQVIGVGRARCDLADADAIRRLVRELRPDVIVNAGAYTAVDQAEKAPDVARAVNAQAPGVFAEEAAALGSLLVHYSTDYVFDGQKAGRYVESDEPNPLSVYGATKLEGERAVGRAGCRHLIFRTSWAFGVHGVNFPKQIIQAARRTPELRVVADQFGTPTSTALTADVTAHAIRRYLDGRIDVAQDGVYHLTAQGETSWFEYARHVIATVRDAGLVTQAKAEDIKAVSTSEYPTSALRPKNSRLDTTKLRQNLELSLPAWQVGVDQMLAQVTEIAAMMADR
ncbi:dTDP-4-dehydrorhamnose reductase [Burkholderia sp. FERM BP-3421]|jgi:dTDP-4-dehydrorhamnose reductase|uniref:dTDP-4-dehydrorhamnose reductase n=1 Tax=Burkholderia sp. FERM BP-3421 TaxID=1494466 RepID=UPI002360D2DA|nr:dTDP-4-dehydrorhamnose reductase [Burkholderia sp. FERM BP-3421]WDD93187.1 dTDP-4-dehydrorhamnose reductase [Burkholderia sp. FERM BP-3421]